MNAPKPITAVEDVRKGEKYFEIVVDLYAKMHVWDAYTITHDPYEDDNGWWVKARWRDLDVEKSLKDNGVVERYNFHRMYEYNPESVRFFTEIVERQDHDAYLNAIRDTLSETEKKRIARENGKKIILCDHDMIEAIDLFFESMDI